MSDDQGYNLSQFKATYFEECAELLAAAEEAFTRLHDDCGDDDDLHSAFRSVHSIKGGAGAFSFDALVKFAHVFETALDGLRSGRVELTHDISGILVRGNDVLGDFVRAAQAGVSLPKDHGGDILEQLRVATGGGASAHAAKPAPAPIATASPPVVTAAPSPVVTAAPPPAAVPSSPLVEDQRKVWKIRFVPLQHMLQTGNDPLLIIRELETLGELEVRPDRSRLPNLQDMEADVAYLAWTFLLTTDKNHADISEVFEFVAGDHAEVVITPFDPNEDSLSLDEVIALPRGAEDEGGDAWGLFDALPVSGKVEPHPAAEPESEHEDEDQHEDQHELPGQPPPAGDPHDPRVGWGLYDPNADARAKAGMQAHGHGRSQGAHLTAGAPGQPGGANVGGGVQTTSIRVDLDKIDRLVNMVGELVITQAMLGQQASAFTVEDHPELVQGLQELSHHTRELQESVMAIRAQPVKALFSKAPRLVRDLAAKLGKQARLVMSGETTEVDKTVIEQLSDPMTHLIRNALDHGLETPAERLAAGKPEEGTIHLNASHRSGRIVIEISDDGRGINRQRVLEKAMNMGLVERGSSLTDEQIDMLVFAPGFSTADSVSDVSGRGVGMDVVRKNIQDVGGRVTVQSAPGIGARFLLSLPLTLAVMDGMLLAVGTQRYVLPLTNIVESLRPTSQQARTLVDVGDVLTLRGEYIRLIPLHELFAVGNAITDPTRGLVVVVETDGGDRIGLLVDELLGQQQVVIKSLDSNFRPITGISAATILGDGRVALILDVSALRAMGERLSQGGSFARAG